MGGWRLLSALAILLAAEISCAPISGSEDRVEVHCINEYRQYCQGKPNGLRFSDGCRECKCENSAVLCKKGGCRFFPHPGQDILEYCEAVYQKNAQKLASKKRVLSKPESRNNATTKVDLNSDGVEELTDQEKAEAAAKLKKLVETYISNQRNESTSDKFEKSPHQMNKEDIIIEGNEEQKRGTKALKPSFVEEPPFNHSVKPELGESMSESELTYSTNSNDDLHMHPSLSVANHDATQIHQRKEGRLHENSPWERLRHFNNDKYFIRASGFRPKRNPEYNTGGVGGDISVSRHSNWLPHPEHGSDHKSPLDITVQGRVKSRNRNLVKNKWKQEDRKNEMLDNAASRGRKSLPKSFARKQTRSIGSSQNWPSLEEDFRNRHSAGLGNRHDFIPVQRYKDVNRLAGNKHRKHRRQLFASLQGPHYGTGRKAQPESDETIGVGSVPDSHVDVMQSADIIKRNIRPIHPDYFQMQDNELDEKEYQEFLDEAKTFMALSSMAVNLIISEQLSQNNSKVLNIRNTSEFKRIVAMIDESIRVVETEVERFSLQTTEERRKLLRDIPERLSHLLDWIKKAGVMLDDTEDSGNAVKNEQLKEIIVVMEDIASNLSAAVEREFETWNTGSTDETRHLEGERHLYDHASGDDSSAEAKNAAMLEWKFTRCMMLCSRFFEMA